MIDAKHARILAVSGRGGSTEVRRADVRPILQRRAHAGCQIELTFNLCQTSLTAMDLRQVEAAASSEDPVEGLRMVLALHRLADSLEDLHVARAREQGMSWADIAVELQVTRQTVHKKHARPGRPRRWSNHADV